HRRPTHVPRLETVHGGFGECIRDGGDQRHSDSARQTRCGRKIEYSSHARRHLHRTWDDSEGAESSLRAARFICGTAAAAVACASPPPPPPPPPPPVVVGPPTDTV